MVKFKCNQSGNIFEFVNAHDIKTMRTHPEYSEVVEDLEIKKPTVKPAKAKADTQED